MTADQILVLAIIPAVLVLFAWGRLRHDIVAATALIAAVILGLVPAEEAFLGFGHPATITVVAVLIMSRGLSNAGTVDFLIGFIRPAARTTAGHVGALAGLGAAVSSFINNVGALALFMPAAIETARRAGRSPGAVLMPLAFGTVLGGIVTLIGTPPNVIVATYRGGALGERFGMFDFAYVGLPVAVVGVAFVALVGWRLIPRARRTAGRAGDVLDIEDYVAEVPVPEGSAIVGRPVASLEKEMVEHDAFVIGLVRGERRILAVRREPIQPGDLLLVEAGPQALGRFAAALKLELVAGSADEERDRAGDGREGPEGVRAERKTARIRSDDVAVVEVVVTDRSRLVGREAGSIHFRRRYGVNLLGISRQGRPYRDRLASFVFQAGDVLLLQGDAERLPDIISAIGCLPLAARRIRLGGRRRAGVAAGLFAAAVAAAATGALPFPIALSAAAIAMVILNIVPPRELYESVDWPVVVLLGSMIPIGTALETTGATQVIAGALAGLAEGLPAYLVVALILVFAMTLSDVMNNAATAVIMAPIAVAVAAGMGVSPDPFLMAVAVGASCSFLTPIGHQNNTLVLGPGGYRFGDYWRMGLPLEVIITVTAVPLILTFWPL